MQGDQEAIGVETVHFDEPVGVGVVRGAEHRQEDVVAVVVELRALAESPRVLERQRMEPELLAENLEVGVVGVEHVEPEELPTVEQVPHAGPLEMQRPRGIAMDDVRGTVAARCRRYSRGRSYAARPEAAPRRRPWRRARLAATGTSTSGCGAGYARAVDFDTVVMKFGGSSVADPDKIKLVARRLAAAKERGLRVVGTVSAMGKTTDGLIDLAHQVSPSPDGRELDMLLSTGERIACALVAMAIHDLGQEAVSLTGSQAGILTDAAHTKAKIREIRADRVREALDGGKIVLVAGFQGFSRDTMDVTTLGRGGTDATAVALAAALGAACEIYSDVPGVFTADPRIVPGARKLARVSYEEMLEMSASGAKVLMLRSVELARNHGVRIHARSTFSDEEGTWVQEGDEMEQPIVSAVTHSENDVVFTLTGIPDRPGVAAMIFDVVAAAQVNVDTIIQNVVHGKAEMSFSVPAEDVPATRSALDGTQAELGAFVVEENHGLGKVSLIGAGMRSHPGVAAKMFRTLADGGVNLEMISTSPIKISCMIARAEIPGAVRSLHDAFELEGAPIAE